MTNRFNPPTEFSLAITLGTNGYLIKVGEEVTGYNTYLFGEDHLKEVLNVSTALVEIPETQSKKEDFSSRFGKGKFLIKLYQDKATV